MSSTNAEITLNDCTFSLLLEAGVIQQRIQELAHEIRTNYENENVIFVIVLKGSFIFAADLVRAAGISTSKIACISAKSYGNSMQSSGDVIFSGEIGFPSEIIQQSHIIIVEDIVDSGLTVSRLREKLHELSPKSVRIATLLFKEEAFRGTFPIEFVGFSIPNIFVVGCGLDYAELGRELAGIYALKQE